jgi:hypothetical protein
LLYFPYKENGYMRKPSSVMRTLSFSRKERYAIAVFSVALAAVVRLALEPVFGHDVPLSVFGFAVIVASWCGGLGPGLLATALSVVIGDSSRQDIRYSTILTRTT